MQFYEINICQIINFWLYIVYNKHDDDKYWQSNKRKIENIITSALIIFLPTVCFQTFSDDLAYFINEYEWCFFSLAYFHF